VSVSESVTQNKLNALQITDHNLKPIFTKLAIIGVSEEMWSPIVFSGNLEYLYPSNRKWN